MRLLSQIASVVPILVNSYAEAVELDVTVIDDDAPRVVVTKSDGNTKVIRGGAGDDNTVRLVNAPTDDGTVNLYRRR